MKKKIIIPVLVLLALFIALPKIVLTVANYYGKKQEKYAFHIGDLSLNVFALSTTLKNVVVFHPESEKHFLDFDRMSVDYDLSKDVDVKINKLDVLLSSDIPKDANDKKDEEKKKSESEFYLNNVNVAINSLNVENTAQKDLISLRDFAMNIKNVGLGDVNEKTKFNMNSKLLHGGTFALEGSTHLEGEDSFPFDIRGSMKKINEKTFNQLIGDKLPFKIKDSEFEATILARTQNGEVIGEINPALKDFEAKVDKKADFIDKTIAKVSNAIFEKADDSNGLDFSIPFVLNRDFKVDLEKTLENVKIK